MYLLKRVIAFIVSEKCTIIPISVDYSSVFLYLCSRKVIRMLEGILV